MGMGPSMYPNAGYDPRKDFAPIGGIAAARSILVVGKDVPAHSVAELIELARKEPGKLTYRQRRRWQSGPSGLPRCSPAWPASSSPMCRSAGWARP